MKKTVKILSIISGVLLIGNTVLMLTISNLNFGLVPVAGLGAMLLGYGLIFDKIKTKKIIHIFVAVILIILLACHTLLWYYYSSLN